MKRTDAEKALQRLIRLIRAHQLDHDQENQVQQQALKRDPGCKAIWPARSN